MAASTEADLAAKLLERLLGDPAFRARFRRDPAGACREAGLESLAQEMSVGGGKAMHTLDVRESKSSLAGVMMAAAMEGVAIYQFTENVLPHLEEIPGQIADVLSRVDLPAIPDVLRKPGSGGDAIPAAVEPPAGEGGDLGRAADAGVSPGAAGAAAAATPPAAAVPPPTAPAAADAATAKDADADAAGGSKDAAKDAAGDGGGKDAAAGGADKDAGDDAAQEAAKKIAEENSPEAAEKQAQEEAAGDLDQRTTGVPSSSDLPTGDTTLPGDAPAGAAPPADPAAAPPAGAAPPADPAAAPPSDAAPPAPPPEAAGAAAAADGAPVPPPRAVGADAGVPVPPPEAAGGGSAAPDTALPTAPPEGDTTLPTKPAEGLEATEPPKPRRPRAGAVAEVVSKPKQRAPIDPSQFGAEGKGGPPDPEALALLKSKNVVLDADGVKDIKAGRIDPRVVAVLTKLSQEHKITVTCMCSDHDKFTSGGSISNHHLGRGMDIGAIDGEIVGPGSPLARAVASELSTLNADYRPNEIGSPFAIAGPGYFTDGAHQNHLHIGFKQAIAPDWKPPADGAADGAPAAAAPAASAAAVTPAVAAAPVAPAAAAPVAPAPAAAAAVAAEPPPKKASDSQMFLKAVTAKAADADREQVAGNESMAFLKAVEPPKASAAAAPAGAPVAAAADAVAAAAAAAAPDAYPGDNAPREQIAAWMAGQASKRGLPPELPLMASLVESGMKNLNFGDADSVGFFQMRVGIWNQGEYAGYPDKPELQVKWFLDTAERVKAQRLAAGKSITDPSQFGEWIADVERPAEQYRGRYQLKLAEAQDLLKSRPAEAAAPVAAAVESAPAAPASSKPIDPAQFGGEGTGTGGPPSPEALALLNNKNVVLDSVGVADIKAGRIDPRVIGVLTKLSQEHKITVTCMCSDHSKFTSGGSISNHHFGRGMDIGAIDGEIVGPGSPLARAVASELSTLNPDIRPNEIGSPFAIAGPGYFTDGAHQNHLHIGFKQAITPDWKPPADVAASGSAAAAPAAPVASAAAATPGAPAAAAAAPPPGARKSSQMFLQAVTAKAAEADRKKVAGNESMRFLRAVEPPKASAAAAPVDPAAAQPAAAAVADPGAAAAAAPDAYPGDDAPREQVAAWMAGQASKRGLPPQLPLMASLVESGMKNLNFGDADSVGFFQMRVGIWNQGAYAGYPDKPELQVKWFLDQAEAVKRQRLVAGKSITDPSQFGEWIADVERPAEQFRGRYQTKLEEANGLLKAAPARPAAAPAPAAPAPDPAAAAAGAAALGDAKLPSEILAPVQEAIGAGNAPGPKALAAIQEASKYIGTDYKWGGSTPQTGFDCSGLMQWAYAQSGVQIPRVTYTQIEAANGVEVADRANLKPGDLVFFSNAGDVHHVGMFLGGDKFLHAPHTGDVVKVSSLSEPYYAQQFAGGRRFDAGAPVAAVPAASPAVASAAPAPAAAAAAGGIDPTEVAKAQAAVARDAAEVRRHDSQLFQAVKASEASKEREKRRSMMFLKAIDPSQVKRPDTPAPQAAAAAEPPAPIPEPAVPAPEAPAPAPAVAEPAPAAAAPPESVAAASIDLTNAATDYPGDNASQAELAKWLAKQAEKAGLPPELPVMASLVESGVKNLNFGDRDSVGFFQMRTGIWNQGAYAGYPDKPELQAKWFIDQALAVKRKAIAGGDADFGKDPAKFGEWIANVERPAVQFRGRYQLRLGEARKLLS
jgi:cell wall-associated NlpC family hydrolase